MLEYGSHTIEQRAIPDFRDGLKPVHRMIVWAAKQAGMYSDSKFSKSAFLVGRIIGEYHPHGDAGTYKTMCGLTGVLSEDRKRWVQLNSLLPLIEGYGNFGDFQDGAAAHRYTECRLTKFAELLLLDPTYLAVTPMLRNFTNTQDVPLVLPARLPLLLVTGTYGIAVGVTCSSPSYKLRNVAALTQLYLTKDTKAITSSEVMKALGRPAYNYGGTCISPPSELKAFVETGRGKFHYQPSFEVNKNIITMTSICVRLDLASTMEKIASLPGVRNVSESTGSGSFRVIIKCQGNADMEKTLELVKKACTTSLTYSLSITNRIEEDNVTFKSVNVMQLMEDWLKWRVGLEISAIDYLIAKHSTRTAYLQLLQKAVDHLQVILDSLRLDDSAAYISKKLKITLDEANTILDLRVRQLKTLELKKLKEEEAKLDKEISTLRRDRKNPRTRILADLQRTMGTLKALPETSTFM